MAHPTPSSARVGAKPGRPALRVADVFRRYGAEFAASAVLTPAQHKVLRAVSSCRTEALGGHLDRCTDCGFEKPSYNSCRDRHCPGCQAFAARKWLEARMARVLPTHHFHVVFTLPSQLRPLALRNGEVVFPILLRGAAEVLSRLGEQRLGAQLGVTTVLHTWTRAMQFHPHVHCVVTGGGLALGGQGWKPTSRSFLFPVAVMRTLFRGIVRERLKEAFETGQLDLGGCCAPFAEPGAFGRLLRSLYVKRWVVYSKPPFAGVDQVFAYMARYTHRVAISDHRLVAIEDDGVTFKTKDGGTTTLAPTEFIRRFLLHVLPAAFHKIRHYGLYASANVNGRLQQARGVLGIDEGRPPPAERQAPDEVESSDPVARQCPACHVGALRRLPLLLRRPAAAPSAWDTS